jgi:pyruvate, orthophosphate dikinase
VRRRSVRFVHPLDGQPRDADVVGRRGARLGGLISLGLPVAPGFVIGTAAWQLDRLLGGDLGLPVSVAEEIAHALEQLDDELLLSVAPAPAGPGVTAADAILDVGLGERTFATLARRTSLGHARRAFRALGAPRAGRLGQVEAALRRLFDAAATPTAVIVQARTYAEGRRPAGRGTALTRDAANGAVWPTGEFRTGRSAMDLDELSRWLPPVGVELRAALARVESLHKAVCEVDFTLEDGRLWFDDARPARRSAQSARWLADVGLVTAGPGS